MYYIDKLTFNYWHIYRIHIFYCDFSIEKFICFTIQRSNWNKLIERCQQLFCEFFESKSFSIQQTNNDLIVEFKFSMWNCSMQNYHIFEKKFKINRQKFWKKKNLKNWKRKTNDKIQKNVQKRISNKRWCHKILHIRSNEFFSCCSNWSIFFVRRNFFAFLFCAKNIQQ